MGRWLGDQIHAEKARQRPAPLSLDFDVTCASTQARCQARPAPDGKVCDAARRRLWSVLGRRLRPLFLQGVRERHGPRTRTENGQE